MSEDNLFASNMAWMNNLQKVRKNRISQQKKRSVVVRGRDKNKSS